MKNIAILDTSIMSFNLGDQIIMESARRELEAITQNSFIVNMPTHSPLFHRYEFSLRNYDGFRQSLDKIDLKFVCGTNLLSKDMKKRKTTWNIRLADTKYFRDYILVGAGTDDLPQIKNKYTKRLYQNALSHSYIHSTRDEKTKQMLEQLGFQALNTGCVTMWSLTDQQCKNIPKKKSDTVVFTITDYMPEPQKDRQMITTLLESYNNVYCWLQGILDVDYLKAIGYFEDNRITYIPPSLYAYNQFLLNNDCDYVGTRLHAGIKAMQLEKRSIIIGIDNRAREIKSDFNINYIERNFIDGLKDMIYSQFSTEIHIDSRKIKNFLEQFSV